MSSEMDLIFACVLFLLNSGAVFSYQVENGAIGGSVYFSESVPSELNPALTWTFKSTVVAQRFPGSDPVCATDYAGRCDLSINGTLRLDRLTLADEGNYTMLAQYSNYTLIKQSTYGLRVFHVLSTPVLTRNGTSNGVINGTVVSLHCDASSQTVSTYTFYRDEKNVCSESHVTCKEDNLYFQPITERDSGHYTCTIQNPVSINTSNTLQLSVSVPISDVQLTRNISGLVWPGLDSLSLTCSARGTNVSYSWSLQGAPLPTDPHYHLTENNQVLIISPVSDKDNETFACTASNWINNMTSNGETFQLAIGVSDVTLTSNTSHDQTYIWAGEESVSLYCSAQGSEVTFVWKLNGQLLSHNSRYNLSLGDSPPHSILSISPVSKNDNGTFTCEGSNRLGSKHSNGLILNLVWVPENPIQCTAKPNGKNVTLGCSWLGGQPAANVSLSFSEETDRAQDSVTMEVSTGGNFQGSILTCNGDLLGRTSNCSVSFGLPQDPEFKNNTLTTLKVGEDIVLTVNLDPALPANFSWNHPSSGPIKMSRAPVVENTAFTSILQIKSATVKDSGKYECKATNIIGTETFLFDVKVSESGLDGGAIAGIVIGVLAAVTLIGILVFFIVKKKKCRGDKKGINEPEYQQEISVQYATVQKNNGGIAQTSLENDQQEDDVKYAVIKFPNNSSKATVPPPVETEYSSIKPTIQQ